MSNCLKNTVQLLELCDSREDGAFYINDIPYLSESAFAFLRDAERATAAKVFEAVEDAAISSMKSDVYQMSQSKLVSVSKTRAVNSSEWTDSRTVISTEAKLKGWMIDLSDSPYQELTLNSFELRSSTTRENEVLYIFDLYSGALLDSIAFSLAVGHNSITLDTPKTYTSRRGLFIAYDATDIDSWQNTKYGYLNGVRNSCACGSGGGSYQIDIVGDPATMAIYADSLDSVTYNGLNIKFRVSCSLELLKCDHKELLIEPLRQKMALVYFQQADQIGGAANPANMIDRESMEEIKALLKDEYLKGLNTFFNSIKADGFCFRCKAQLETIRQLP